MISMLENTTNTQYFCIGVGGSGGSLPSPDTFNPELLDVDQWLDVAVSYGAKYAVLVAQHCSGFSMWPTDVQKSTGFNYTYSTRYSSFRGGSYDLVKDFVDSCKKHDVQPGIYYSLNQNYYLNSGHGIVLNTTLVPGQAKVSQELYGKIVLAQMRELWTNYGALSEIWFDGGCSVPGISDDISNLLEELQPQAVYFGGCAKHNNLRWVGTESGEPGYPIWSTAMDCKAGLGDPQGNIFCPAETDTTLQEGDHWFWRKGFPIRSLEELQKVYVHSVGRNTNLLLNTPANKSGLIEDTYADRYKEFGEWINGCFGKPVATVSGKGYELSLTKDDLKSEFRFSFLQIREDQSKGQAIRSVIVAAYKDNSTDNTVFKGSSVGNKFIWAASEGGYKANELMLKVTDAAFEPTIIEFSVYNC